MPWLYYEIDGAEDALTDSSLPTEFRRNDILKFKVATYNLTGHYMVIYYGIDLRLKRTNCINILYISISSFISLLWQYLCCIYLPINTHLNLVMP